MGDTVNVASRLEGINKGFDTSILVGAAVRACRRRFPFPRAGPRAGEGAARTDCGVRACGDGYRADSSGRCTTATDGVICAAASIRFYSNVTPARRGARRQSNPNPRQADGRRKGRTADMRISLGLGMSAALLGGLALATTAIAADAEVEPAPPEAPPQSEWVFTVAPYFWMAGIDGDVGLFGLEPVTIDESFSDIIKDFKVGGMVVMDLNNGTWGVFADVIYVKTEADESVTRSILGVPVTLSAGVETSSFTGTLMGEYRIYSEPVATVDLMAGARIWSVDNDINIALAAGGPPLAAFSGSDGSTWVDPMIGARGRYNIDESWYLNGWAMIGGFSASSEISWDVLAGVGYQYNDWLSFNLGYRALGVDYENDGFVYDIIQHGPILGAVMKF
jgi:hypothetical protein